MYPIGYKKARALLIFFLRRFEAPPTRLVAAQDTGNAIRGPIRADFFCGYGDAAGENAGRMKQAGSLWLLLPNGMRPAM